MLPYRSLPAHAAKARRHCHSLDQIGIARISVREASR